MKKIIKSDLHIHSNLSDGKYSVAELVDIFGGLGFDAIAITDHICEKKSWLGQVARKMNYSLTQDNFSDYMTTLKDEGHRALEQYGMLLIPGFEITKNSINNNRSAHILVLGTEEFISPDLSVEEVLLAARDCEALTIAAHPFNTGDLEFQTYELWSRKKDLASLIDAWEVNHRKTICPEILTSGFPLIASSDFHHMKHLSSWKTKIYSDLNQENIFHAIREQRLDFFYDQQDAKNLSDFFQNSLSGF